MITILEIASAKKHESCMHNDNMGETYVSQMLMSVSIIILKKSIINAYTLKIISLPDFVRRMNQVMHVPQSSQNKWNSSASASSSGSLFQENLVIPNFIPQENLNSFQVCC